MSGSYRIEISPNNRAQCRNKECKDKGVKIFKGQLRLGTFVVARDFQSFHYKHWGCVTPKVLQNIKASIEGNFDLLDGFEDLPQTDQDRVEKALEAGHVDDEEFNGDIEMNREGKNGMRTPISKRKMRQEKAEHEGDIVETDTSPRATAPIKRSRVKPDPDADIEAPAAKKPKGPSKRNAPVKIEDDQGNPGVEAETEPKKKSRSRAAKNKAEDELSSIIKAEDSGDETAPPPKSKKSRVSQKQISKTKRTAESGTGNGSIDGLEASAEPVHINGNDGSNVKNIGSRTERAMDNASSKPPKGRKKIAKVEEDSETMAAAKSKRRTTSRTGSGRADRVYKKATRAHPGSPTS